MYIGVVPGGVNVYRHILMAVPFVVFAIHQAPVGGALLLGPIRLEMEDRDFCIASRVGAIAVPEELYCLTISQWSYGQSVD